MMVPELVRPPEKHWLQEGKYKEGTPAVILCHSTPLITASVLVLLHKHLSVGNLPVHI